MKILITSGGTKVPIDDVRSISNMSSGRFGSAIATAALRRNHKVIFLKSKDSKSPFVMELDFRNQMEVQATKAFLHWDFTQKFLNNFTEVSYSNYDSYADELKRIVVEEKPDITILVAAVSDYITEPVSGKVRSSEQLEIKLKPAEKLISKVKQWCPSTTLVGFKLMVNSTEEELLKACHKSIEQNNCDMVVGNDLRDIKVGDYRIRIVRKEDDRWIDYSGETSFLANGVIGHAESVATLLRRS